MRRITVPLPDHRYEILIGSALLEQAGHYIREAGVKGDAVAVVQDAAVVDLYGGRVVASLRDAGYRVVPITIPSGETSKCLRQLGDVYDALAAGRLDRGSALIALGGGVAGDLGGFAAATYLRGIDFVQVPTTLLAQVDASVGGKTGIDLESGKNLVGAFHQPRLVLVDLNTLQSLPQREYRAGLAEVIKYGIIADARFFEYLRSNREAILAHQVDELAHVVARSCELKAEVVGQDEREAGLRAILNYGHTIGHAVEAVAGYGQYLHGEAVALGMVAATWLSHRLGWLGASQVEQVSALIESYGLPVRLSERLDPDALLAAMKLDKKTRSGTLRFVLAREIGRVEVAPVEEALALEAAAVLQPT